MSENVRPIRADIAIPPEVPEGGPFFIEIGTWIKGDPVTIRHIEVEASCTREEAIQCLRDIGHSWQYDINHVGRLKSVHGEHVATLHIFQHTYRVDVAGPEER